MKVGLHSRNMCSFEIDLQKKVFFHIDTARWNDGDFEILFCIYDNDYLSSLTDPITREINLTKTTHTLYRDD